MSVASWLEGQGGPASRDRLIAYAPRLAVWTLALALGVQAAVIVTRMAGADHSAPAASPPVTATAAPPDITRMVSAHLFGAAPVAPAPQIDENNAPATSMPLVLTGILTGHTPQDGMAILGPSPTATRLYAVKQRVPGNAVLYAVYDDRVVLDRNGNLESLMLPHAAGGNGRTLLAPTPAPVVSPAARVQRALDTEPGLLANVMRPQPVFADGRQLGYRVYPARDARAFASLGLRNGDLVTSINGMPLDDPNRGDEIFRTLASADQARITVTRDGQQQELTLNLAQLANQAEQLATGNAAGNGGATAAGGQNGGPARQLPGRAAPGRPIPPSPGRVAQ
jgi:general secretion pathway protein C